MAKAKKSTKKAPAKKTTAKKTKAASAKKPKAAKKPAVATKAAKKPAPPTKAPAAKPASGKQLRGVALVEAALAKRTDATPTPPDVLANTTLGGRPLTPALKRWLESDSDFFTLGEPQSLTEMLTNEFGDHLVEAYQPAIEILTEPIVLFEGWGSDSRRFIYLGKPDSHGELPVFTVDDDDGIFLCLNGPVDVWLAQQAGAIEDEHVYGSVPKAYEPARTEHAKLNFAGNVQFTDYELSAEPITGK